MYSVPVGYVLFIIMPLMFLWGYCIRYQIEQEKKREERRKRNKRNNRL